MQALSAEAAAASRRGALSLLARPHSPSLARAPAPTLTRLRPSPSADSSLASASGPLARGASSTAARGPIAAAFPPAAPVPASSQRLGALERKRSMSLDEGLTSIYSGSLASDRLWAKSFADSVSSVCDSSDGSRSLGPDPLFDDEDAMAPSLSHSHSNALNAHPVDKLVKSAMDRGELVPDDHMVRLVDERLPSHSSSPSTGWILDGFPRSGAQVDALARMRRLPDAVIHLDVHRDDVVHRMLNRRVDPVTGNTYNLQTNPPSDPAVAERLVQRRDDNRETLNKRLDTWSANWKEIEDRFAAHSVPIFAVQARSHKTIDDVYTDVRNAILAAAISGPAGVPARPLRLVFTGAPGSGKGTQCERVSKEFGMVHLSTGQILREVSNRSGSGARPPIRPAAVPVARSRPIRRLPHNFHVVLQQAEYSQGLSYAY